MSNNLRTQTVVRGSAPSILATNSVLRNTYWLLGLSLALSALTAWGAMALQVKPLGLWMLLPYFALSWLINRDAERARGILWVFLLTGFLGYTLGPILNVYTRLPNGQELVFFAFAATAGIFVALSAYTLITQKSFKFLTSFIFVGAWVAFFAGIAAVFFNLRGLSLVASSLFVIISSGMILWQTSEIIEGGETNYIRATVTLYVSIFNLFISLLQLLGLAGRDE